MDKKISSSEVKVELVLGDGKRLECEPIEIEVDKDQMKKLEVMVNESIRKKIIEDFTKTGDTIT
jgi:hypothetical protein